MKPKSGYGRVMAKGAFSLGTLRKSVRHTLCGDDWIDIDVANCHPAIILQLCRAHGIACAALKRYVTDREACLAEIAALFKDGAACDAQEVERADVA